MKLFGPDLLCTALLLFASAGTTSAADPPKKGGAAASKPGLEFDASCNTRYGKMTAKEYINRSIKFMPELAKAGKDGLETFIQALEVQSKAPGAKKPTATPEDLKRIIATYRVLFGDIKADDPAFQTDAKTHITKIKETMDSLNRMANFKKPDLMIHCNDDWLDEKPKAPKVPKPTKAPSTGHKYLYDTDRHIWEEVKGGKPCQGNKAAVTSINKEIPGKGREKGKERITFCKAYFDRQKQLETDGQPHIWDIAKNKLPETFTTYKATGAKDETLPFHISAFGKKFGAKWFHEFMHTALFNPGRNEFSDKNLPDGEGGSGNKAYGFEGAVGLAKQNGGKNIAKSSRNIENILYWSLAMYHNEFLWITGSPEDPTALTAAPAEEAPAEDPAAAPAANGKVKRAKKPPKTKQPDSKPPKTDKPADPPKTDKPADPPKTDKPADPPKTSAAAPPPPPPPPPTSQAPPPATSKAPPPPPPTSKAAPPPSSAVSAPQTSPPVSSQKSASTGIPGSSITTPVSKVSSNSIHPSCSNTLCTRTSSMSSSVSQQVPKETFESEPINAGSMTGAEIAAIGVTDIAAEAAAIQMWDQLFDETVPEDPPTDELPTDELPTDETPTDGLPTDGLPTDGLPTDGLPVDGTPTDETPIDETPTDEIPTDGTPTDGTPTDEVPTDEVPTDEVPTDEVPTDEVPTDGVPTDGVPTDGVPTDGVPAETEPIDTEPVETDPTGTDPTETIPDEIETGTDPVTNLPDINLPDVAIGPTDPTETDPLETIPTGTVPIEADPSASMGTGLPMATGAMNGTWTAPVLRSV